MDQQEFGFGYRDHQSEFIKRFGNFLALTEGLSELFHYVDERARPATNRSGTEFGVCYFLYRQIIEDFNALLILCSSGFSRGAMILLRSMYEHCTTLVFFQKGYSGQLDLRGDDIQQFVDYSHISRRKSFLSFKNAYQGDLPSEEFEHIEKKFLEVKEQFTVSDCSKCLTNRINFRWSKRDIVSMSKAAGLDKDLTFFCYSEALVYTHPSAAYIEKRLETDEEGSWAYQFESERDERLTLMFSHLMTLIATDAILIFCDVQESDEITTPHTTSWRTCWSTD